MSGNAEEPLRHSALKLLAEPDLRAKIAGVRSLPDCLHIDSRVRLSPPAKLPGRPELPRLVEPAAMKNRSVKSLEGRAALLHSLAHIEMNAVDLALDAVWRFPGMPETFYREWLHVAREEAFHFSLLSDHLQSLGYRYGDFDAHNGLWEMAEKTKDSVLARIALVPRTLEARGLDASPLVKAKLIAAGDARAGEILDIILRDEVGHVALGNRWYAWLCEREGLDPIRTFERLRVRFGAPRLRGPFNLVARRAAGFTEEELAELAALDSVTGGSGMRQRG